MSGELPPCLQKPSKGQRVQKVLEIIQQHPTISFEELHSLVGQSMGVSPSTAYDYLRLAREALQNEQAPVANPNLAPSAT